MTTRSREHVVTKRQREILTVMSLHPDDEEGEIVYERGVAYLGDERIAARTVNALLRLCALRADHESGNQVERYHINGTGRKILVGDFSDLRVLAKARALPPTA